MIFTGTKDKIKCETWSDTGDADYDDVCVGHIEIRKNSDGYYRFYPIGNGNLTARDCKDLLEKLRALNREVGC